MKLTGVLDAMVFGVLAGPRILLIPNSEIGMVAHASGVRSPGGCAALDFDFGIRVNASTGALGRRPAIRQARPYSGTCAGKCGGVSKVVIVNAKDKRCWDVFQI